ncbi:MAG: hypothetical protein A3D94_04675 [Alphaproteobacteria bacterium RIFCSPHIGHO2_12_FULL_66_14]|nr:MAG: hypothetical protein A3D94_04675 [Alphaproteobacteria bacterium RIFCSPHIGHO2_12_FULL_66_14]
MMWAARPVLLAVLLLAGVAGAPQVQAQMPRPPMGGPGDVPVNPPTTRGMQDFVGTWRLTWQDPVNPDCPCHGSLWIDIDENADGTSLDGHWKMKGGDAVLHGVMSYQAKVWSGRFAQADDGLGYPMKGHFRLESRDANTLTGSYQRNGTAVPFSWTATRD